MPTSDDIADGDSGAFDVRRPRVSKGEGELADDNEVLDRAIIQHWLARIPSNLSSGDAERIRRGAIALLQSAAALRQVPLTNADEPDPIFVPYRRAD
jgi:hypothetical protein